MELIDYLLNKPPEKLYKYREVNENNLTALFDDRIYVPRADRVNDKNELALAPENSNKHYDEIFNRFIKLGRKGCYILSFTILPDNLKMWNKYCEKFSGFVLEYDSKDIIEQISKSRTGSKWGYVKYNCEKVIVSKLVLDEIGKEQNANYQIRVDEYSTGFFFIKTPRWKYEEEFRFAFGVEGQDINFINKNDAIIYKKGFFIENVIPTKIFIGFNMEEKIKEQIIDYCLHKHIKHEIVNKSFTK